MKISDAEFHRILILAVSGWDETYGKKTLAEMHSQGVIGERERLLALLGEVEKAPEPQQESEPHVAGKKTGNIRQAEEE
jgi:hypothetical protein